MRNSHCLPVNFLSPPAHNSETPVSSKLWDCMKRISRYFKVFTYSRDLFVSLPHIDKFKIRKFGQFWHNTLMLSSPIKLQPIFLLIFSQFANWKAQKYLDILYFIFQPPQCIWVRYLHPLAICVRNWSFKDVKAYSSCKFDSLDSCDNADAVSNLQNKASKTSRSMLLQIRSIAFFASKKKKQRNCHDNQDTRISLLYPISNRIAISNI